MPVSRTPQHQLEYGAGRRDRVDVTTRCQEIRPRIFLPILLDGCRHHSNKGLYYRTLEGREDATIAQSASTPCLAMRDPHCTSWDTLDD